MIINKLTPKLQYPSRKRIRLLSFDYSTPGYYFLTLCSHNKKILFGEILNNAMQLNAVGQMITSMWLTMPKKFHLIGLDQYIVMPNHLHGIIILKEPLHLSHVIQAFKSVTTNAYIRGVHEYGWEKFDQHLWQRSFYDHVIRNEEDLLRIQEYILNNPLQWALDNENPQNKGRLLPRPKDIKRADTRSAPTDV